jgi:hypothetical protein
LKIINRPVYVVVILFNHASPVFEIIVDKKKNDIETTGNEAFLLLGSQPGIIFQIIPIFIRMSTLKKLLALYFAILFNAVID